jgi:hypothetical protein
MNYDMNLVFFSAGLLWTVKAAKNATGMARKTPSFAILDLSRLITEIYLLIDCVFFPLLDGDYQSIYRQMH